MTSRTMVWAGGAAVLVALAVAGSVTWTAIEHGGASSANANDAEQVALGEAVYGDYCAARHGANLEGQPNWRERKPDCRLSAPPHDAFGHTWHHRVLFGSSGIASQSTSLLVTRRLCPHSGRSWATNGDLVSIVAARLTTNMQRELSFLQNPLRGDRIKK